MNDFINHICFVKNHPIAKLDESFRVKYLKGVAACISQYRDKERKLEVLYNALCFSINGSKSENAWLNNPDKKDISNAIRIQRNGWRLFTMRLEFFFDCFYIIDIVSPGNRFSFYEWIRKEHCGIFAKRTLKKVYQYFENGINQDVIPQELINHKVLNEKNAAREEKTILVVANVSAGKSTLVNALIGYRLNRTKTTACTSKLCHIHNKPVDDGVLSYSNKNREYYYSQDKKSVTSDSVENISLNFNSNILNQGICFIDTPGINNIENSTHRKITEDAIKSNNYNAIIYISNCQYFGTTDERRFLEFLKKHSKKPIIFVLNQLDRFKQKEDSISKMLHNYYNDLLQIGFENPKVIPISAYPALLFKLPNHSLDEDDLYDKAMFELKYKKEYYNMQSYNTSAKKDTSLLGCSGINYLEEIISQI